MDYSIVQEYNEQQKQNTKSYYKENANIVKELAFELTKNRSW